MNKEPHFTVMSDDGAEPTLIYEGDKTEVYRLLSHEYDPKTVRVSEYEDDSEDADRVSSLNGEEWLRQNPCPVCCRMDFDAVLQESMKSRICREGLKVRMLNAEAECGV